MTYDPIKASKISCSLHHLRALAVIHVYSNRYFGVLRGLGGGVQQKAVRVLHCPWEELQNHWRVLLLRCSYTGQNAFEVVQTHCWDGPASCGRGIDNGLCSVVGWFGHG